MFDREYEGTTSTLSAARNELVECLTAHEIDHDLQDRAELVLSELATNAIQASPGNPYGICLMIAADRSVVIAVTNIGINGRPPTRDNWGPETVLASRGRGLLIVSSLADDVSIDERASGAVVVTATFSSTAEG